MRHYFRSRLQSITLLSISVLVMSVVLLSACIVRKPVDILPFEVSSSFTNSGDEKAPGKWWEVFNDEGLNGLVTKALSGNRDIKTAWFRLKAAKAAGAGETSALFPELEGSVSAETGKSGPESDSTNQLEMDFGASYELDLWGRIGSRVKAGRFDTMAFFSDFQAAALSISAEIAITWFNYIEAVKQIKLIAEQIATNEKMLSLIKARVSSGQVRGADILRQKLLIEAGITQKIEWEARAGTLKNQLAVLSGVSPVGFTPPLQLKLPELPPLPDTGIPSELVNRRPDVRSAYFRLKAADLRLASAVRDMYPRFSFRASVSTSDSSPNNILKNWASSLAGNLLAPLFYGGRLRAEMKRSMAVKEQYLQGYVKMILNAFKEVEDALLRERNQAERIVSMQKQVDLGARTIEQLRIEYFNGIADYLDVLSVLKDEQRLRREILSDRVLLLEYRIALYRAIAGGFKTNMENGYDGK